MNFSLASVFSEMTGEFRRSAACVHRTTRRNVPSNKLCEPPPKPRVTVKITAYDFLSREGLLRNFLWGELSPSRLRFVAATDLVGLDTVALRYGSKNAWSTPMRSAACIHRTTRRNVPCDSVCVFLPPSYGAREESVSHDFLPREGLFRNAGGKLT